MINKDVKLYVKKPKYRIDISDTITKHKNGHAYNSDMYNSLIIHKGNYYMKIIDKGICIKNCYSNKTIIIINDRVISYQN